MAAIDTTALIARDQIATLVKRKSNWAGHEAGVIVVFAIVFVVAVGIVSLLIHKCLVARKSKKPEF